MKAKVKPTGFSTPLSFQQVVVWALMFSWVVTYILFILPVKSRSENAIMSLFFSLSTLSVIWYGYFITKSNPTDSLEDLLNGENVSAMINCALCNKTVRYNCKHCMVCYRCVDGFDHHCTWVNNCIGKQNYSVYLKMIISFEIFLVIYFASCVDILNLEIKRSGASNSLLGDSDKVKVIGIVFIFFFMIIAGIGCILNGYLILFHVWLFRNKLTTYQYLTRAKVEDHPEKTNERDENFNKFSPDKANLNL